MNRWKGILRAAAPLTALLVIAGGARLMPSVFGKEDSAKAQDTLRNVTQTPPTKGKEQKAAPAAPPKRADAKTQAALQKAVGGQLAAFRKDDFAAALRYSAPQFRQNFTPTSFKQMIKGGYAGLLNYKSLRFTPARLSAGVAMMPVFLKSEGGTETGYLYILRKETVASPGKPMKETKPAIWCIEGVSALDGSGYPGGEDRPGPGAITGIREI